jgi:hypothetical protein
MGVNFRKSFRLRHPAVKRGVRSTLREIVNA